MLVKAKLLVILGLRCNTCSVYVFFDRTDMIVESLLSLTNDRRDISSLIMIRLSWCCLVLMCNVMQNLRDASDPAPNQQNKKRLCISWVHANSRAAYLLSKAGPNHHHLMRKSINSLLTRIILFGLKNFEYCRNTKRKVNSEWWMANSQMCYANWSCDTLFPFRHKSIIITINYSRTGNNKSTKLVLD